MSEVISSVTFFSIQFVWDMPIMRQQIQTQILQQTISHPQPFPIDPRLFWLKTPYLLHLIMKTIGHRADLFLKDISILEQVFFWRHIHFVADILCHAYQFKEMADWGADCCGDMYQFGECGWWWMKHRIKVKVQRAETGQERRSNLNGNCLHNYCFFSHVTFLKAI